MKNNIHHIPFLIIAIYIISCSKSTTKTTDSKPFVCGDTIIDINGNTYHTVSIGSQCWMKENLKTSKYNDGTTIPNVTDNTQWTSLKTGAYCYNNNNPANNTIYGKLYNWYAVNTNKLAPAGWHVATESEWLILANYLGGDSIAGDKMKDTILCTTYSGIINTNNSGLSALPAGSRSFGIFGSSAGVNGGFWSSTEWNIYESWTCFLTYFESDAFLVPFDKDMGLSVRCVKDE